MEHNNLLLLLPEELVSDILLRLPAKSLGKSKCVCKSWCSTINNLSLNLYLLFDTTTYDSTTASRKLTISRICYDTLGAHAKQTLVYPDQLIVPEFGQTSYYNLLCTCNGLILFCGHHYIETKWLLWNPTTGQTKLLPSSTFQVSLRQNHRRTGISYQNVGFGFDTNTMDHKVVLIHKEKYNSSSALVFEMYSLKTNSWKRIASTCNSPKDLRVHDYSCGIFSNAMLSWKASYKEDGDIPYTNAVISVDLSSETIITTPLPSTISLINHPPSDLRNNYCLVYKESLALVHWFTQARKRSFDLWVLGEYGVKDSWKKLFTIGPLGGIARVLGFLEDSRVFVQTYHRRKFKPQLQKYINEKQLLLLDTPSPTQLRHFQIFRGDYMKVLTYRESLVPLN